MSFGVEAWNSYATTFPRNLRMVVIPDVSVALTNLETGKLLNPAPGQIRPSPVAATNIAAGTWPGYDPAQRELFVRIAPRECPGVPYTNRVFLTNATYRRQLGYLRAVDRLLRANPGRTNVHVPHWQLNLRTRLRFAVVDTSDAEPDRGLRESGLHRRSFGPNRCPDAREPRQRTLAILAARYTPNAQRRQHVVHESHPGGSTDDSVPTFGILNQIEASLGHTSARLEQLP